MATTPSHEATLLLVTDRLTGDSGPRSSDSSKKLMDQLADRLAVQVLTSCASRENTPDTGYQVDCYGQTGNARQSNPLDTPVACGAPAMPLPLLAGLYRRAARFHVIHAWGERNGLLAGLVGRLRGTPVITTLTCRDLAKNNNGWLSRLRLNLSMSLSAAVTVDNERRREELSARFPRHARKLHSIAEGIDDSFYQIRPAYSAEAPFRLLTIATENQLPALHSLLGALTFTTRTFHLTLLCPESVRHTLQDNLQRLKLAPFVSFITHSKPDELHEWLEKSHIYLHLGSPEAHHQALNKAKASARAVIASNSDGISEHIHNRVTGLIVDVMHDTQLANVLDNLSSEPGRIAILGLAARNDMRRRGATWDGMACGYERLYEQVGKSA
ncbi:MAG: glycosyltransferase family 4 protein [Halothiobacillaceae bacterium]|jgi:glycosyltransferase involved in cell wall biosynthesis|nr:glycosyltransferase family 4 protein [Halothiobacillaceae bacterium]